MAKQTINLGTGPDSYTGDNLRTAFEKVNDNFDELYAGEIQGNIYGDTITANAFITNANATLGNIRVVNDATIVGDIYAHNYYFANSNVVLSNIDGQVEYAIQNYQGNIGVEAFIANVIRTNDYSVSLTLNNENDELIFATNVSGNIATLSNVGYFTLASGLSADTITGNVNYTPANASMWVSPAPTTIAEAIDRLANAIVTGTTGTSIQ